MATRSQCSRQSACAGAAYLSTYIAMLDSLGYRELTSKAILAHTLGGIVAAVIAHLVYMLIANLLVP